MTRTVPPSRPDEATDTSPHDNPEWMRFIQGVQEDAKAAWASGRVLYQANFFAVDNPANPYSVQQDAPGAIEAIERVGWKLEHAGYVNANRPGQSSGIFDSASSVPIIGIYLFRRPE